MSDRCTNMPVGHESRHTNVNQCSCAASASPCPHAFLQSHAPATTSSHRFLQRFFASTKQEAAKNYTRAMKNRFLGVFPRDPLHLCQDCLALVECSFDLAAADAFPCPSCEGTQLCWCPDCVSDVFHTLAGRARFSGSLPVTPPLCLIRETQSPKPLIKRTAFGDNDAS